MIVCVKIENEIKALNLNNKPTQGRKEYMEKKIIIFCLTTALALIAIVGLNVLFGAAFSPKAAMASSPTSSYRPADFSQFEQSHSKDSLAVVQPVPEPATICMLAFGGTILATRRNRKNKKIKTLSKVNQI